MNTISLKHFCALFFLSFLAMNFLTFPSRLCSETGTDGLFVVLISCVFAFLTLCALAKVFTMYRKQSFKQIITSLFGKFFGKIIIFFYFINMLYLCAYSIRLIGEQISIYMLRNMNIFSIEAGMLLLCLWFSSLKIKSIGNFAHCLVAFLPFVLLFIVLMSASGANVQNMLPLFTTPPAGLARGVFAMSAYLFSSLLAFPVIAGKISDFDEKKARKYFAILCAAVFVIYSAYYLLCVCALGEKLCSAFVFPALCAVQSVKYENVFIQRYELLLLMSTMSLYFVYSSLFIKSAGEILYSKDDKPYGRLAFCVCVVLVLFILNDRNIGTVVMEFADANNLSFPHNILSGILSGAVMVKRLLLKTKRRAKGAYV